MIRFCAACEDRIFGPAGDDLCPECRRDAEEADRYLAATERAMADHAGRRAEGEADGPFDESEVPW